MKKDYILIIPARIASTRLPNKLLLEINSKSIIQRTYECALAALGSNEKIIIATDSCAIEKHCRTFGANVIMTSKECLTGTDRVAEVAEKIEADQYINLQGDEPIFPSKELSLFINTVTKDPKVVHTAITKIKRESDFRNLSIPKMVFSNSRRLLYSSRAAIPSSKDNSFKNAYKHVCIYAFNKDHLKIFKSNTKTDFENQEDLEINRFLEMDITVKCVFLKSCGKAVDTIEDFNEVSNLISKLSMK